jgi:FkbM family methyltransferase
MNLKVKFKRTCLLGSAITLIFLTLIMYFYSVTTLCYIMSPSMKTSQPLHTHKGDSLPISVGLGESRLINCSSFLEQVYSLQNLSNYDSNNGRIFAKRTVKEPFFLISLHNEQQDSVRWGMFEVGYYYELDLTQAFVDILKVAQAGRVLDVGGNIGWFTLVAASLGQHVDVFEPNLLNGVRICESVKLNGFASSLSETSLQRDIKGSVNYFAAGVGARKEERSFFIPRHTNPGVSTFLHGTETSVSDNITTQVHVVSLDRIAEDNNWFQSRPLIHILKIDVEGFEHQVRKSKTVAN